MTTTTDMQGQAAANVGMSNFRLFCIAAVAFNTFALIVSLFGPEFPKGANLLACDFIWGVGVVAVFGDRDRRTARAIVEGR